MYTEVYLKRRRRARGMATSSWPCSVWSPRRSKDYEELVETSASMIQLAMTSLMIRCLCQA